MTPLAALVALGVALITSTVGPIVVLTAAHRLRRENTDQHAEGRAKLDALGATLNVVHDSVRDLRDDFGELREEHGQIIAVHAHRLDQLEASDDRP